MRSFSENKITLQLKCFAERGGHFVETNVAAENEKRSWKSFASKHFLLWSKKTNCRIFEEI